MAFFVQNNLIYFQLNFSQWIYNNTISEVLLICFKKQFIMAIKSNGKPQAKPAPKKAPAKKATQTASKKK